MRDSGVYYLQIRGTTYWFLKVYCEQEIADGGWTVSLLSSRTVHYVLVEKSRGNLTRREDTVYGCTSAMLASTLLPRFYRLRIFVYRSFKGGTISGSREKISIEIGRIIKTDLGILLRNFGWATRIFICWRTTKITCSESSSKTSKVTKGIYTVNCADGLFAPFRYCTLLIALLIWISDE